MAGSEQVGLDGASGELFVGATWVLTPTAVTDPAAYAQVRNVLADLGADVVALAPAQHDALVAVVSHVPHLTAATLMDLAAGLGEEHAALLQLAAGRVPGHDPDRRRATRPSGPTSATTTPRPSWTPSTCSSTRSGPCASGWPSTTTSRCSRCSSGRPTPAGPSAERAPLPEELVEVRVPVPDRTGVIAEITVLAAELGINIVDLEIAHSVEGDRGVLVLVVDTAVGAHPAGHPVGPGLPGHQHPGGTDPMTGPPTTGTGARAAPAPSRCAGAAPDRHRRGPRGQVHLPPGPAPGRPGRGDLDHHRPVRRGRRGPHRRPRSAALGAGVERDGTTRHRDRGAGRGCTPRADPSTWATRAPGMRLLAGVAATLAGTTTLTGDDSLRGRPMDRVAEPLDPDGGPGDRAAASSCLPPLDRHRRARCRASTTRPRWPAPRSSRPSCWPGWPPTGETVVREPVATRAHTEEMLAAAGRRHHHRAGRGRAG